MKDLELSWIKSEVLLMNRNDMNFLKFWNTCEIKEKRKARVNHDGLKKYHENATFQSTENPLTKWRILSFNIRNTVSYLKVSNETWMFSTKKYAQIQEDLDQNIKQNNSYR